MSGREVVILGTSSQVPTRHRNHNGYLLLWDGTGVLVDPGEGTQRQMIYANIGARSVDRICLTHLHGDHCLGLPGVLQRRVLDGTSEAIPVHYPAESIVYVERLVGASVTGRPLDVDLRPVDCDGVQEPGPPLQVSAFALDHRTPTHAYRFDAPVKRSFDRERLAEFGIFGPAIGRLAADGRIEVDGREIHLDDVSELKRGVSVAVVMDTRVCDGAGRAADGVDLLVCEATYRDAEAHLAEEHAHLTARQAATLAKDAGAGMLVLTHFSSRYDDTEGHLREAREVFEPVVAADDLARVPVLPTVDRATAPCPALETLPGTPT
jgi:ribonuclease Z